MSKPDANHSNPPKKGADSSDMRIDAAHALIAAEANMGSPEAWQRVGAGADGEEGSEPLAPQIRSQAGQLAEFLRSRQRQLDHREARLHAQIAQLESDERAASLKLREREAELDEREGQLQVRLACLAEADATGSSGSKLREADLGRRETDLTRREEALHTRAESLRELSEELSRRQKSLRRRERRLSLLAERSRHSIEADLARREEMLFRREMELDKGLAAEQKARQALRFDRQKLDAHREATEQRARQVLEKIEQRRESVEAQVARQLEKARAPSAELVHREEEVCRKSELLDGRQRQLDEADAAVLEIQAQTKRLREQINADRRDSEEQARSERKRLALEKRSAMAELEEKRQAVARRSEHVDKCQASLQQLRSELAAIHQDTLEIRLATEELWTQLSGSAPPAAMTRSLGQVREKLAEHYKLANTELAEKKQELKTLQSQLAQEHRKLVEQKRLMDRWATEHRQEIDQQAERLLERERELKSQEVVFNDLAQQWQTERLNYQRQISALKSHLERPHTVPAAA